MSLLPVRHAHLMIEQVDGETLVWDAPRAQAVTLSPLGGAVLASCDGESSVAQAATALQVSENAVEAAVAELVEAGLVRDAGMSRRDMLKRSAVVGGVVLAAVAVPTAAAAASNPLREQTPQQLREPTDNLLGQID